MKSFKQYVETCCCDMKKMKKIKEDGIANGVGGGAIAGIGVGKDGEPGVTRKKNNIMAPTFKRKPPQMS
jgi:hypothetical protein